MTFNDLPIDAVFRFVYDGDTGGINFIKRSARGYSYYLGEVLPDKIWVQGRLNQQVMLVSPAYEELSCP